MENPFKWRHFQPEIILLCVRWYLRHSLSYQDLAEMMTERGLLLAHTTIYRWVQQYAPEKDKRCHPYLKQTNDSWRLDKTYVKVRGRWMYLYRAVDSTGQTLDFLLNETRGTRAAKRFFRRVLGRSYVTSPRVINVDKNPAYIGAVRDLKREKMLSENCKRRPSQYMNNIIEQDHRFIKRKIKPGLGFFSYPTAWRTIRGYETVHMIRKGQIQGASKGNIQTQNQFIAGLFGSAV
ncbi:MAG: IS6 family transposase [Candidatus Promineifilaceae bacterium]